MTDELHKLHVNYYFNNMKIINSTAAQCLYSKQGTQQKRHHDHTLSSQTYFARDMNALIETIDSYGNPFKEETSDLLVLDTRDVVDPKISQTIRDMKKI